MKKETIHVKVDHTHLPNEMHFDVQRKTRMNIFRNRKKYSRKKKHKNLDND